MSSPCEWITVGALADGFAPAAFILPRLAELAGRQFTLPLANGWRIEHRFEAERGLRTYLAQPERLHLAVPAGR